FTLRRHPRCTLFPYTTLFRSEDLRVLVMSATLDQAGVAGLLGDASVIESQGRMFPVETRYLGRDPVERVEDATARAVRKALAEQDRKSTRLNSSHVKISYAVF